MSKISMQVSVGDHSFKKQYTNRGARFISNVKHSALPRVYKSDINLLHGLYILLQKEITTVAMVLYVIKLQVYFPKT